ncbi:MAG TPA: GIY-YIG nuclease family protein, partial [Kiritimatiellia bacterium]|nr:GIY-YIG nuclease family protein [Kiritimatiellia bacterium]
HGEVPVRGTKPGDTIFSLRFELRLGKPVKSYSYVYILQSEPHPERHYTGLTDDMPERLRKHNAGECRHTAKYRPWLLKVAIAFAERDRAAEFEGYLKTHSGRVFASRHF